MASALRVAFSDIRETLRAFGVLVISLVAAAALSGALMGCGVMDSLKNQETRDKDVAIVKESVGAVQRKLESGQDPLAKWLGVASLIGTAVIGIVNNAKANTAAATAIKADAKAEASATAAGVAQSHVDDIYTATHAPIVQLVPPVVVPTKPA